jgi:hypothetical protein
MKKVTKFVLFAVVPILGATSLASADPASTTTIKKVPENKVKIVNKTSKQGEKSVNGRDPKSLTSEKIRIERPIGSQVKPLKPVLRITYPPNNIWVNRGTRIILNGTATHAGILAVDARYDGTVYTHRRIPGTNAWIKDKVGKPFTNSPMWSYNGIFPNYENGIYKWSFNSILTEEITRKPGGFETVKVPKKVRITVKEARNGTINKDIPPDTSQTITVDIRD